MVNRTAVIIHGRTYPSIRSRQGYRRSSEFSDVGITPQEYLQVESGVSNIMKI
jgi:hypothetical protein